MPRSEHPAAPFRIPFKLPNGITYEICEKPDRWNDTPYWAMQMPSSIVRDHSGIFNDNLVGVLGWFLPQEPEMADPRLRPALRRAEAK